MERLEIYQRLIWAIILKIPSNNFYAITTKIKKKLICDGQQQQTCDRQKSNIFNSQLKYLLITLH